MDTLYANVLFHNMIIEACQDAYESKLFTHALAAVENDMILDEEGNEMSFTRWWRESLETGGNPLIDMQWEQRLSVWDFKLIEEVAHFALKHNLVEQIWSSWGLHSLEAE